MDPRQDQSETEPADTLQHLALPDTCSTAQVFLATPQPIFHKIDYSACVKCRNHLGGIRTHIGQYIQNYGLPSDAAPFGANVGQGMLNQLPTYFQRLGYRKGTHTFHWHASQCTPWLGVFTVGEKISKACAMEPTGAKRVLGQ